MIYERFKTIINDEIYWCLCYKNSTYKKNGKKLFKRCDFLLLHRSVTIVLWLNDDKFCVAKRIIVEM